MTAQYDLVLPGFRRGFHLITQHIAEKVSKLPETGILHVFLHHTSAGLMINENADPSVRADLGSSFDHLVPEREPHYTHIYEGDDDMPSHIKSGLSGVSLTIPIANHRLKLGTWQGIYLCEYRNHGGGRRLTLTVIS